MHQCVVGATACRFPVNRVVSRPTITVMTRPVRHRSRALVLVAVMAASSTAPAWLREPARAAGAVVDLDTILVDSPEYRAALAAVAEAESDIAEATARIRHDRELIVQLESGLRQLRAGVPVLHDRIAEADELVRVAVDDLAELAVLQYVVKGSDRDVVAVPTDGGAEAGSSARRVLVMDTAMAGHRAVLGAAERRLGDATRAVQTAELGAVELSARLEATRDDLAAAEALLAQASSRLPHLEQRVAAERRRTRVVGSDIGYVALEAYVLAARSANQRLDCAIDWAVLAAIGRVESRHGTHGGGRIADDGTAEVPIIGIALDGTRETAVVLDSDEGSLDGDTAYDRAVGPMQFIPTTWARFAVDGNGDGRADPQNIYDAARAAADYLCRAGRLDDEATLRHAILTYNHSDAYLSAVLGHAAAYRELARRG